MSVNRVQKLLFSEYCDFEDMVLIESPFAQTTKDGKGIRQVHLGLTPSKLVLATDVLPPVEYVNVKYLPGIDPEIETFELIAIYPVECVNLSIYRRKRKQALKARFCNNKVLYFELGGFEKRAMFWNLWCEKVKFLSPGDSGSSHSETSVATSSTGSTLYLLDQKLVTINGIKQLWCKFGSSTIFGGTEKSDINDGNLVRKWTDKHLYMGKDFEINFNYKPVADETQDYIVPKKSKSFKKITKVKYHQTYMEEKGLNFGDSVKVNRFGSGIFEGCGNPLYLTADDYIIEKRLSQLLYQTKSSTRENDDLNYYQMAESAILTWEFYKADNPSKYKIRHRRRYGLATQPLFLYGFDRQFPTTDAKYSTMMKRVSSEIHLRDNLENEFDLSIDHNLLISSISFQSLNSEWKPNTNAITNSNKSPLIAFWTPGYEYFPKSSKDSYEKLNNQIKKIKQFQENSKNNKKRKRKKKNLFKRTGTARINLEDSDDDSIAEPNSKKIKKKKHNFIYNILNKNNLISELDTNKRPNESSFHCFKRMLRVDIILSAWDVNSTTFAENLTMIDKELFLKIPTEELEMLVWQKSSENATNLAALISFAHRISCLIADEILKSDTERSRARLIARFINTSNKCHRIANFQSCKTILSGLQSPAIYRLRKTWAYVRKKHASKYESFEILCRLYKDPRLPAYQKTFFILSQTPPYLPHIGDVISRLLGKVPNFDTDSFKKSVSRMPSIITSKSSSSNNFKINEEKTGKIPDLIHKIYRIFIGGGDATSPSNQEETPKKKKRFHRKAVKFKTLYEYYSEMDFHEAYNVKNLQETKLFLEKCQLGAIDYNFGINNNVREYLLKSRYKDDKQNFCKSLSVETPCKLYD